MTSPAEVLKAIGAKADAVQAIVDLLARPDRGLQQGTLLCLMALAKDPVFAWLGLGVLIQG